MALLFSLGTSATLSAVKRPAVTKILTWFLPKQDIAIFKAQAHEDGPTHAQADLLEPVSGCDIGAIYIDDGFEELVRVFLNRNKNDLPENFDIDGLAFQASMSSDFQDAKVEFDPADSFPFNVDLQSIPDSQIDANINASEVGLTIKNGLIKVDR